MKKQAGRSSMQPSHRGPTGSVEDAGLRSSTEQVSFSRSATTRPLLLGHRGARPLSRMKPGAHAPIPPENTLACFEYALHHGCDGFEFDVRTTRDHKLVLCHDASFGGHEVATALYGKLCSGEDERVPCLEDVLTRFGDRAYLDIEVKVPGGEESIVEALRRSKPQRYLLSSFLPQVLRRFDELDSSLSLGYICDRAENVPAWRELPIQVFLPQFKLVTENLVRDVHSRGLQIFTWTVNRKPAMQRLAAWGVDGLISDDPALLSETFVAPQAMAKSE